MTKIIILNSAGGPESLQVSEMENKQPVKKQVLVKNHAVGINQDDLLIRSGKKLVSKFPCILGYEASGEIVAIGDEVDKFSVGDRVAYFTNFMGCYSEMTLVNVNNVVRLPEEISYQLAAASYFKGMIAHMLVCRVFLANKGTAVLIHNATGGVENIVAQWANLRGALVIGTVESDHKKDLALKLGCHKAVNYKGENWHNEVLEITKGEGVSAVYDSLGVSTFQKSFACLMQMGVMVHYNFLEGRIDSIKLSELHKKSLFLTYPSVFHYKKNRMELVLSANEFFETLKKGGIKVNLHGQYPLTDAQQAHKDIESGSVIGSVVLKN